MTTLANIIPDANSVLALEPEELAGIVLELMASAGPNEPSRLHPSSITSAQTIGQCGREGIGRAFYCFVVGQRIVMLNAFVKKTQETPEKELRLARKRMNTPQQADGVSR